MADLDWSSHKLKCLGNLGFWMAVLSSEALALLRQELEPGAGGRENADGKLSRIEAEQNASQRWDAPFLKEDQYGQRRTYTEAGREHSSNIVLEIPSSSMCRRHHNTVSSVAGECGEDHSICGASDPNQDHHGEGGWQTIAN